MQHGHGRVVREAESEQATTRVQREGFGTFNADQWGEAAQLAGDFRSLALELAGIWLAGVGMAKDVRAMQADTGAKAALTGQQLDDARHDEAFLRAKQGAK